jgi:V/A-type H+-transporting ATPase subunit C
MARGPPPPTTTRARLLITEGHQETRRTAFSSFPGGALRRSSSRGIGTVRAEVTSSLELSAWIDTAWVPPDDTRYARAVGLVRVRERELLSTRRLRALAECEDLDAAVVELEDTVYGPGLSAMAHPEDFETVLQNELKRTYDLFSELCVEPEVDLWLRVAHDAANIKAMVKGGVASPLSEVGLARPEELREAIDAGDYRGLQSHVARLAEEAVRLSEEEGLLAAELWVDREVVAVQDRLSRARRNPFLRDLSRIKVDLANLATTVRLNRFGKSRPEAAPYIAPGGSFTTEFWLRLCGTPYEEVQDAFFMTEYHAVVSTGVDHLAETGSFRVLEKLAEEHLMRRLRDAKTLVFGIEPVVAFVLAKEHEVAMVRMALVGKQNDIPSDLLAARVSLSYA